ncbi:FkbM family methyltransferase [Pajaroellobacter abortibovis]|uniref:Methyltransferase FkbM domain-containing protein n=1 Tax=Pajaroellobacter abortibovis TaxID=1882918 RepID=A0A1L6MXG5_9BACT|nr:FkbM family methyltransferase [Pajaroellobacter abortibovis]APS00088.1 hypothetical protein BCY86_04885 [Pajaroellobacter abortibovis]
MKAFSGDIVQEQTIGVIRLDEHFSTDPWRAAPNFIKIDAKGHDYEVLQGAYKILEMSLPTLMVEMMQSL